MSTLASPPSSSADDLAALRSALAGQYTIERELGRGGMGVVLLARDERLDRLVALKVLPPALAGQPQTRERFLREARMAAQLSHPNIVPVHRADEIGGFAFFAMGFVDGETLADRIRDRGTLAPAEVVRVLREVAWALAYAHARGIVHRDVKPENILLERSTGRAIVTDFGIARADFNPALTQDGYVMGTVHYMSPEQSSGLEIDGRSDLYALGCIGFLALSGRLPFEGPSPQAILVAHATKEPPTLRSIATEIPAALADVIDQCLRKSPDARFRSGEALADALAEALGKAQQQSDGASGGPPTREFISGDDAMAVWRRAAELQAEAASRLESRLRASGDSRTLPAAGSNQPTANQSIPSDAYRLRDVEAAAAEVGISQKYVALALSELRAAPNALQRADAESGFKHQLVRRLVGDMPRTLAVSRVFQYSPRVVLRALGRSLSAPPWSLTLRDTLGGHALDGGVLLFDIPSTSGEMTYKWSWTRYSAFVPELRMSLAPLPGSPNACEVTLQLDLRRGFNANLGAYATWILGGSGFGGFAGLLIAKKALLMAGAALLGPAAVGAGVLGMAAMLTSGPMYRWGLREAEKELRAALDAVNASMRVIDVFETDLGRIGSGGSDAESR